MNTIILDRVTIIDIIINEDSICNIDKSYNINELNVLLKDGVKFEINHYSEVDSNNLIINIRQDNNSKFIYNHSFVNKKEYNMNINIDLSSNNSKNTINIHGISDGGISNIIVNGKVSKYSHDNELLENIKLININDGKSYIHPNMFIDTKNVIANHAASISTINEDYLFYLKSKGIEEKDAKKLIINGFLDNVAK